MDNQKFEDIKNKISNLNFLTDQVSRCQSKLKVAKQDYDKALAELETRKIQLMSLMKEYIKDVENG